jgi:hypothetical protein
MWIEHFGNLSIMNLDGSLQCTISFKKSGIFQGTQYKVEGFISDRQGKKLVKLEGKWNESLEAKWLEDTLYVKKNETRTLWTIDSASFLADQYNFTQYTASLNSMSETDEGVLLPSDSRRRLDRKCLEKGNSDSGTYWKKIIEDKQRSNRKTRKSPWQPVWFRKEEQANPAGGVYDVWVYDCDFWEERSRKEEFLRQGDLQLIQKMIPPQIVGTACDFMSYENSSLSPVTVVVPSTTSTIPDSTENKQKNSAETDNNNTPEKVGDEKDSLIDKDV